MPQDFSLGALYEALDVKRQVRGLSWAAATHEISGFGLDRRAIASSTITGLKNKRAAEGNGILHMLLWLDRTPESFMPGFPGADDGRFRLPAIRRNQILQFDAPAIHRALNAQREARGLTWSGVAQQIGGTTPGMLTNLAKASRVGFPGVMRLAGWLEQPVVTFVRIVTLPFLGPSRGDAGVEPESENVDPRQLVVAFNECINNHDLAGLAALMTDDHVFIDTANHETHGMDCCVKAWQGFFEAFPDYRNVFDSLVVIAESVVVVGRSRCADLRLQGPALWSVKFRGGRLSEWRVYDDTPANRSRLGAGTRTIAP